MQHITMGPNGRLVIPAPVRAELGMQQGGAFLVAVEDGQLVMRPYRAVIEDVWAEVRRYIPAGDDLAADLLQDRRREDGDD